MSRFDSIASEAAWAVYLDGFAHDVAGESDSDTGYVFATVSPTTLLNIGEPELSERLRSQFGDHEVHVVCHEVSTGFVRDDYVVADVTGREMARAEGYWSEVLGSLAWDDEVES